VYASKFSRLIPHQWTAAITASVASQQGALFVYPTATRPSFASARLPAERPGKAWHSIDPFKHYVKNIHINFFRVHLGYRVRRKRHPAFFNNQSECIGEIRFFSYLRDGHTSCTRAASR
jgi:hypothetical protein